VSRILGPSLVAAGLHALLLTGFVAAHGGDPAALVCVGGERVGRPPFEAINIAFRKHGYDGQFYYALARAPWRKNPEGLDNAPVRQLRILYPAVSWLMSGGDARLLLWALPLVNLLAIAGLAGLGASLAGRHGLSPWWGALLPVALNVAMPALRDLGDVLSTFAVCGLVVGWLRRGPWWELALWAAAAVFCREQNLAVIAAVLAVAAWRRQAPVCLGLIAVVALWATWVGVVWALYGQWPMHQGQEGHIGWPLVGMFQRLQGLDQFPSRASAVIAVLSLLLILAEAGLAVYLLRFRPDPVVALTALGGAALAVLGGFILYEDHWGYSRVFALLPLGVWLGCVQARWRAPLVVMSASVLVPLGAVVKAWTEGA
jgi:hypothetical protein